LAEVHAVLRQEFATSSDCASNQTLGFANAQALLARIFHQQKVGRLVAKPIVIVTLLTETVSLAERRDRTF